MLRAISRYRFCIAQRNFFTLPPLYPEKEDLIYRPKIANEQKQQKDLHRVYAKKVQKITEKTKNHIRDIKNKTLNKQQFISSGSYEIIKNIVKNVYIDQETQLPGGLFFDDFILDIKSNSGQKYEAEYAKKAQALLKQMKALSETELIETSKDILAQVESGEHFAQARQIIFEKLKKEIKNLDQQSSKQLFGEYFDKNQSNEFLLNTIQNNDEDTLKKLISNEKVDILAEQLAKDKLNKDIQNFKILDPQYGTTIQKSPIQQFVYNLGFYESPVTVSEFSDDERLLNQRYFRESNGQEAIETQESIIDKTNLNFIKRAYIKRLALKAGVLEQTQNKKAIKHEDQIKEVKQYLHNLDASNALLQQKFKTINKQLNTKVTLNDIISNIDYLLLNAPSFVKDQYHDKNNQKKEYESHFQDLEKNTSLLWKDFQSTFQTIFPKLPKTQTQSSFFNEPKAKMNKDDSLDQLFNSEITTLQRDENFAIELYNEFNQPNNLEFFHHYLTNTFRINREQINDGLMNAKYGLNPFSYEIPSTCVISEENDPDFIEEDKQNKDIDFREEQDQKPVEINQLIENDYNEASLLTYVGKGNRKSSKSIVSIKKGTGTVTINGKNIINYFTHPFYRRTTLRVLELVHLSCLVDVDVLVKGGSQSAQAQCICSGLSRAIVKMCPNAKSLFRKLELTITDNRKVERKKIGLYKARKKYPYSRR